jgi:ATP-dependent DNA ligase
MECLAVSKLPDGPDWIYEIKLDGYRAEAIRTAGGVEFYSRNGKSLAKKFPYIVEALSDLPADTIVDGELVALDDLGRPAFNLLQNFKGEAARIRYFAFDLLRLKGRDLTSLPLIERKSLLVEVIGENDRVKISEHMEVLANTMLAAIKV